MPAQTARKRESGGGMPCGTTAAGLRAMRRTRSWGRPFASPGRSGAGKVHTQSSAGGPSFTVACASSTPSQARAFAGRPGPSCSRIIWRALTWVLARASGGGAPRGGGDATSVQPSASRASTSSACATRAASSSKQVRGRSPAPSRVTKSIRAVTSTSSVEAPRVSRFTVMGRSGVAG